MVDGSKRSGTNVVWVWVQGVASACRPFHNMTEIYMMGDEFLSDTPLNLAVITLWMPCETVFTFKGHWGFWKPLDGSVFTPTLGKTTQTTWIVLLLESEHCDCKTNLRHNLGISFTTFTPKLLFSIFHPLVHTCIHSRLTLSCIMSVCCCGPYFPHCSLCFRLTAPFSLSFFCSAVSLPLRSHADVSAWSNPCMLAAHLQSLSVHQFTSSLPAMSWSTLWIFPHLLPLQVRCVVVVLF